MRRVVMAFVALASFGSAAPVFADAPAKPVRPATADVVLAQRQAAKPDDVRGAQPDGTVLKQAPSGNSMNWLAGGGG